MKYFFIGFNKCATGAIEKIFQLNFIKFQHRLNWEIEKYDGFSDTGVLPFKHMVAEKKTILSHYSNNCDKYIKYDYNNYNNFLKLYNIYPTSFFILNTRPLKDWIYSRFKHGYIHKCQWSYPITKELIYTWIQNRDLYYMDILSHFQYNKEHFLIVDISSDNWQKKMCGFLGLKYFNDQFENVGTFDKNIISEIDSVFSELMLPEWISKTYLLTSEKKSKLYKNIYTSNLIE